MLRRENLDRPKRLLSIDGGGIRGIIAAQILLKIESILCDPKDTPWNCLGDYFDFIGGTSTGAILAAGLAKGMKVRDLLDLYVDRGREIFTRNWLIGRLWSKYSAKPLERNLKEVLGTTTLGSDRLRTLLLVVAKNVTTARNWFFVNSPNNKFYDINKDILLWHFVRASTAAPTFFLPHQFNIDSHPYEFIDGGMSMFNNPSFQLFLEATKPDYGIGWKTGKDNLLLISVGTGFRQGKIPFNNAKGYTLVDWAIYAVSTLMEDASAQQNFLMSLFAHTPEAESQAIGRELEAIAVPQLHNVEDLVSEELPPDTTGILARLSNLLTYHRYSTAFTLERFRELGLSGIDPDAVAPMDAVKEIPAFLTIGEAIANEQVRKADFENFLHPD
ncbi:patatin-like phospholipase family protein [Baaleninema simplex]|uniref:patatin-like phospholipase family protein n=1 Tax=Baaleninema simplex TaxID=2862350 RepID=UPI00034BF681|nr:patatin-like phospholipase family protein [Baaleninema simplex]